MDYLIVYNQFAGKGKAEKIANKLADALLTLNKKATLFSNKREQDFYEFLLKQNLPDETTVISVGGDGTASTVINSILHAGKSFAVAVYSAGTANDFFIASHLPKNIKKFVNVITQYQPKPIDLICYNNGDYALHVLGAGTFTNANENFSRKSKRAFGKFGYYFRCFFSRFNAKSDELKIIIDNSAAITLNAYFFYITNIQVAGGFKNFSPLSSLQDNKIEILAIKKCRFLPFCFVFLSLLFGRHIKSKNVFYASGKSISVTAKTKSCYNLLDVDGNKKEAMPLNAVVVSNKIKLYTKEG